MVPANIAKSRGWNAKYVASVLRKFGAYNTQKRTEKGRVRLWFIEPAKEYLLSITEDT